MDVQDELRRYDAIINESKAIPPSLMNFKKLQELYEKCRDVNTCCAKDLKSFRTSLTYAESNLKSATTQYLEHKVMYDGLWERVNAVKAFMESTVAPPPEEASDPVLKIYKKCSTLCKGIVRLWQTKTSTHDFKDKLEKQLAAWDTTIGQVGASRQLDQRMEQGDALIATIKQSKEWRATVTTWIATTNNENVKYHATEFDRQLQYVEEQMHRTSCAQEGCNVSALHHHRAELLKLQKIIPEDDSSSSSSSSSSMVSSSVDNNDDDDDDDDEDDDDDSSSLDEQVQVIATRKRSRDDVAVDTCNFHKQALSHVINHYDEYNDKHMVCNLLKLIRHDNEIAFQNATQQAVAVGNGNVSKYAVVVTETASGTPFLESVHETYEKAQHALDREGVQHEFICRHILKIE